MSIWWPGTFLSPAPTCLSRPEKVEHLILRGFSKDQNNLLTQIPLPVCTWVDAEGSPAPQCWHMAYELTRASSPALCTCPSQPCPLHSTRVALAEQSQLPCSSKPDFPSRSSISCLCCPDGKQAQPHFLCLTAAASYRMPGRKAGPATASC